MPHLRQHHRAGPGVEPRHPLPPQMAASRLRSPDMKRWQRLDLHQRQKFCNSLCHLDRIAVRLHNSSNMNMSNLGQFAGGIAWHWSLCKMQFALVD